VSIEPPKKTITMDSDGAETSWEDE